MLGGLLFRDLREHTWGTLCPPTEGIWTGSEGRSVHFEALRAGICPFMKTEICDRNTSQRPPPLNMATLGIKFPAHNSVGTLRGWQTHNLILIKALVAHQPFGCQLYCVWMILTYSTGIIMVARWWLDKLYHSFKVSNRCSAMAQFSHLIGYLKG